MDAYFMFHEYGKKVLTIKFKNMTVTENLNICLKILYFKMKTFPNEPSVGSPTAFGSVQPRVCMVLYFLVQIYPNEPRIRVPTAFGSVHNNLSVLINNTLRHN